jgi:hypothetical protein
MAASGSCTNVNGLIVGEVRGDGQASGISVDSCPDHHLPGCAAILGPLQAHVITAKCGTIVRIIGRYRRSVNVRRLHPDILQRPG